MEQRRLIAVGADSGLEEPVEDSEEPKEAWKSLSLRARGSRGWKGRGGMGRAVVRQPLNNDGKGWAGHNYSLDLDQRG